MVTPRCSKCKAVIPASDINVAGDVAYCRTCNISYSLSALTNGTDLDASVDVQRPPPGAWFRRDGSTTVIGATNRSLGLAAGGLFVALFWNGITSVFVSMAIAGTLQNLNIPAPHWFPAPKMNGSPMSVGMTIFLWLFMTPFILIGIYLAGVCISYLAGRTEIRIQGNDGLILTGIGPASLRKRFDLRETGSVRVDDRQWIDNDGHRRSKTAIVIETRAGRLVKFGSMLREDRRKFVAGALRKSIST